MTGLAIESKIDFDYSVGTEDRFALRNWFEDCIRAQNAANATEILGSLDEALAVEGLSETKISYDDAAGYIKKACQKSVRITLHYPNVRVSFKGVLFVLQGSFEGYYKGLLSYDGTFEARVMKQNESFKIVYVKVYPRFMMSSI